VYGAYISWLAKATARAKELDLYHRYLYMNYASQFQDVIGGYGETSRAKMRDIAKKYDESNVFQVLQPGYFKL
jgi:vacuolar-type H+-ATPase subunit C/Vma6